MIPLDIFIGAVLAISGLVGCWCYRLGRFDGWEDAVRWFEEADE